jgi:hypothetical protein
LIYDVVIGRTAATVAAICVVLMLTTLWLAMPLHLRGPPAEEPPDD